jgi:hypothetical protein
VEQPIRDNRDPNAEDLMKNKIELNAEQPSTKLSTMRTPTQLSADIAIFIADGQQSLGKPGKHPTGSPPSIAEFRTATRAAAEYIERCGVRDETEATVGRAWHAVE